MRNHVGCGKLAGRPEPRAQFVEEPPIEVHLLICRTVEWARGGLRFSAARLDPIPEQDQLRLTIARQVLTPDRLSIVQDKADKLHRAPAHLASRPGSEADGTASPPPTDRNGEIRSVLKTTLSKPRATRPPNPSFKPTGRRPLDARRSSMSSLTPPLFQRITPLYTFPVPC